AAERGDRDAREALLAGLAAAPAAELLRVAVADPGDRERGRERRPVELRMPARAREAAHVDDRPCARLQEALDELLDRPRAVADRAGEQRPRIADSGHGGPDG